MPPERPSPAQMWLRLARADLVVARTADTDQPLVRGLCCYHCQQATEKAIKAVLTHHRQRFPKVHNLVALSALLDDVIVATPAFLHEAMKLNEYVIDSRYPDDLVDATPEMLAEALDLAEPVVDWAAALVVEADTDT